MEIKSYFEDAVAEGRIHVQHGHVPAWERQVSVLQRGWHARHGQDWHFLS